MKPSERAVAIPLIATLKADGWTVYEEVRFRHDPHDPAFWIADIVATKRGTIRVYEVKVAFGLDVMAQAARWLGYAHEVWIVVPGKGTAASRGHAYGYNLLRKEGLGVVHVREPSKLEVQMAMAPGGELPAPEALVAEVACAVCLNVLTEPLEAALHQAQASGEFAGAGTKSGERVTEGNLAHKAIREYLDAAREFGGCSPLAEVARAVGQTAWLVTKWAKAGKIKGVQLDGTAVELVLRRVPEGQEEPLMDARQLKSRPARYIPT